MFLRSAFICTQHEYCGDNHPFSQIDPTIGRRTVAKHKKDVFRLYRVLDPLIQLEIPEEIREDMSEFLEAMRGEDVDLKNLGIGHLSLDSILDELRIQYVNSS